MIKLTSFTHYLIIFNLTAGIGFAQTDIYDSGGPIMPEQAAYNVSFYDLSLEVNPGDSTITGILTIDARIVHPIDWFVLDLDTLLEVKSVQEIKQAALLPSQYMRRVGKLWIDLEGTRQPGEHISFKIEYGGRPRIAPNPPWQSGFTWTRTPGGEPWIATTSWGDGADVWWPCKDHISDGPDSMALHITVPNPLVVAANGVLKKVQPHENSTTYNWFISSPIDIQNVALSIAPYQVIEDKYQSIAGDSFLVKFWVLPESYDDGARLFPEILKHLRFFEETLGPYPFRAEKYGVVQTPYPGMEHQTIIAYGANFNNEAMTRKDWGFDALHHHELSHEWWGNMVTNLDWRDMWLHEGFGTYMQPLYLEYTQGLEAYHAYISRFRNFWNIYPVAPRASQTTHGIYKAPIYSKGAWVLHTLRYLIGDKSFRKALRRMAYPDPSMEQITDGRQTRYATTDDFLHITERVSGIDLDWFFEVYLRQPELPVLISELQDRMLKLHWEVPEGLFFPMPIDVKIGEKVQRVEIPASGAIIELAEDVKAEIDPQHWVLFRKEYPEVISVESAILDSYVGRYELKQKDDVINVEIMKDGHRMMIKTNWLPKLQMFPESKTKFFCKEAEHWYIIFNHNKAGEVESLTQHVWVQLRAQDWHFKKIE